MSIGTVSNLEAAGSVRAKLNAAIAQCNKMIAYRPGASVDTMAEAMALAAASMSVGERK